MRTRLIMPVSLLLALVLTLSTIAGAVWAQGGGTTVASGFNGPMGVLVAPDGNVWVIDSGVGGEEDLPFFDTEAGQQVVAKFGETVQVVRVAPDGTQTAVTTLPSVATGSDNIGGARLALLDGTLYVTNGQFAGDASSSPTENTAAILKIEDGQVSQVASTWDLEKAENPDPNILDSHPYGLTAGPDGKLWVADAGGNDVYTVDPATGATNLVAVFDGLPGPFPNPNRGGAMETDPVPTAVAFDDAGNAYVSLLSGFPFTPGSAKVMRVSADGQVSDYATGLTMLTDLRTAPDGTMYAVQIAQFTEQGPVPNSGQIIRVKPGTDSEVVVSDLSFPTSIDFNADGDAYVTTNGVGAPGSGELVRFAGLTSMSGSPITEAAAAQPAATEQPAPGALPATGGVAPSAPWSAGLLLLGLGLAGAGAWLKRKTSAANQ